MDKQANERTFWERQTCYACLMLRYLFYTKTFSPHIGRRFQRTLDLGCGPMPYALFLDTDKVFAVDPLVWDFRQMPQWKRFWSEFMQAHNSLETVLPNSIDCAVLVNLLDHIAPDERLTLMLELLGKLEVGGWVFCFTHLRSEADQFHYPVTAAHVKVLFAKELSSGLKCVGSGYLTKDETWPAHWPKMAWWYVGRKR